MHPDYKPIKQYVPAKVFAAQTGWPSYTTLRKLIKSQHNNGFDSVVKKMGRLYLICPDDFQRWVDKQ